MKIYKNKRYEKCIKESYKELILLWNTETKGLDLIGKYGTTHVIEFGKLDGPELVLFHGVGDDAALMWIYNAKSLGEHFHVFAVDTIGGPGLSVPGEGYNKTFDDILWIDEILEQLNLKQVFMAGVSNGGYLTQAYTLNRPEKVIKGVSMAGTVPVSTKNNSLVTMMKIFLPEALFPTDKNVIKLIKKMTGTNYQVFCENKTIFNHFKWLMLGFNRAAMLNHKVNGFSKQQIDSIRNKILYIAGKQDPFMKLGGASLLLEYNMNTIWIENAGHGINHEMAEKVNEAIIRYFTIG